MAKTKGVRYWDKKLIGKGGVVQQYVKLRDAIRFEDGKPVCLCITCKKECSGVNLHGGHWISRRHKLVAYREENNAGQCSYCNKWGNGEPQLFEDALREQYGDELVDELRAGIGKTAGWKPFELEEIYNDYKEKIKFLKKEKGLT